MIIFFLFKRIIDQLFPYVLPLPDIAGKRAAAHDLGYDGVIFWGSFWREKSSTYSRIITVYIIFLILLKT